MTAPSVSATVGPVSTEVALELLKDAGLSGYEAKAYVALLGATLPMNGYEVAKVSGVPRSTVYETLGKLVARGAAFEVKDDAGAVSYVPLAADALIGRLRRQTHDTIKGLESILPSLGQAMTTRVVHHLSGRDEVVTRTIDVVESARAILWLSIWPHESGELVSAVSDALERGVEVFTIAYGDVAPLGGRVYLHSFSSPDVVLHRLECRISITVADHDQAIVAAAADGDHWGIWSDDRAIALLAAEHVRHDIALQITAEHLEAAGLQSFWDDNEDLEALRAAAAAGVLASRRDH